MIIHRLATICIPVFLFLWGMWTFPIALFGPERSMIPGDLGDARFNNYILEHFHSYVTAKVDSYWDAPFMYPWKNVIGHSDNLLGTAPIYSVFRGLGFNRESAFQLWIMAMFALNYWCCYGALRAWSGRSALSACAAFIFAFGIYNIGQMDHAQVYPRFMVPVAFLFMWRFLSEGRPLHLFIAAIATVHQFYCGIYLGFMLLYAMFFLVIGFAIIGGRDLLTIFKRSLPTMLIVLPSAALLLVPLMLPYINVFRIIGPRDLDDVMATLPRPASYFFTHQAALSWRDLSDPGKLVLESWWDHSLFIGAFPWITLLIAIAVVLAKGGSIQERRTLKILVIALLLSTLFIMNIDDHTLYHIFYVLPGFSALRAMGRSINVQVLFFLFLFVAVISLLPRHRWIDISTMIVLPFLVVLDNRVDTGCMKSFDKWASRNIVDRVVRYMTTQLREGYDAIAYMPVLAATKEELVHDRLISTNITAMLAAQQLGVPIVNGYTGSYPDNYMDFFDRMDRMSLHQWCIFSGCDTSAIGVVDNIGMPVSHTEHMCLTAHDGRYVSTDQDRWNALVADRWAAKEWEAFVLVHMTDGRTAILAHNDHWVWADLLKNGSVQADAPELGDFGLFTIDRDESGRMAFRTRNGKYLMVAEDGALTATTDTIHPRCWFSYAPLSSKDHR